jgi:hypothetical protein
MPKQKSEDRMRKHKIIFVVFLNIALTFVCEMTWHDTHHPTHCYFVCSESFSNNQAVVLEKFAEKQACSHSALILLSAGRPSPRAA